MKPGWAAAEKSVLICSQCFPKAPATHGNLRLTLSLVAHLADIEALTENLQVR